MISPDRTQREQVVECESEITARDEQCRERDMAPIGRDQGLDDFATVDIAQNSMKHEQCNHDDGDAERNTDPIPADLMVAKPRAPTQNIEDPGSRSGSCGTIGRHCYGCDATLVGRLFTWIQ